MFSWMDSKILKHWQVNMNEENLKEIPLTAMLDWPY